jgi:outer membrane lipoprotein-sorting protein
MRGFAAGIMTCIGLALMPVEAIGEEKAAGGGDLDARQVALVKKVSGYFSELRTVCGDFVQTSADDRRMRGKFFVKRPGRFRFDYALPSRQIVISDGRYLAVEDLDLNNEDRVELDQTPFRLLLQSDVDLIRDAKITEVEESNDRIVVALQDKDPDDAAGQLKLFLATKPELQLKAWVTKDAQGVETRVEISNLDKTANLDGDLFKIAPLGEKSRWTQNGTRPPGA